MSGGLNVKKAEIQQRAFDAWNVDKFNTCILHTGMGKTFLFFKCLLSVDCKQVLMLAETNLREKNILDDAKQYKKYYGVDPLKGRKVVFMCYQSAYKTDVRSIFPEGEVFVFADEVHELATPARWNFVLNSDFEEVYFLGVTATLDKITIFDLPTSKMVNKLEETTKYDFINSFAPVCIEYNIEEARIDGTTRDLKVYVYEHKLDQINKNIQGTKTWIDTEYKVSQWLDGKFRTTMFMRAGPAKESMYKFLMRSRCNLLYNLPSKVEPCKKLLRLLPGRTLVFGNTSKSLMALDIPCIVAENKRYIKDLEDFQEGRINQIGANKMLLQGQNLTNIDNIIYLSYYSKDGPSKQRAGRARQDSVEAAKIIIFKTINSQEEKWFEGMIEPLLGFPITYVNRIEDCL